MMVGRWRLDRHQRTLSSDQETRSLSPRSWDVLSYLADHRGELVHTETLLDLFWRHPISDATYVRKCIAEIRRALDDDAPAPSLIRTVPKQGYVLLAQAEPSATPSARTLAVLPFVSISSRADTEHFSDGLTEEILNRLTQTAAAPVVARTSSFQFKNLNMDIREIGRVLDATDLLEGSVRRSGATIRITAQLIDARSGAHQWSSTYERIEGDAFEVQDEVATAISRDVARCLDMTSNSTPPARMVHVSRSFTSPQDFESLISTLTARHQPHKARRKKS